MSQATIIPGGICFLVGALAFVGVFSYLAAKFDYPDLFDGEATADTRIRAGRGSLMCCDFPLF